MRQSLPRKKQARVVGTISGDAGLREGGHKKGCRLSGAHKTTGGNFLGGASGDLGKINVSKLFNVCCYVIEIVDVNLFFLKNGSKKPCADVIAMLSTGLKKHVVGIDGSVFDHPIKREYGTHILPFHDA